MIGSLSLAFMRAPLLLAILGYNLSAFSPVAIGRLLTMPIDAIASQVASALGGKCWSVASWNVQIRGKPMCLASSGNSDFDAGRSARVLAVKALGMTFSAFSTRNLGEETITQAETHIQTFAAMLHAKLDQAIHLELPSTLRNRLTTQTDEDRTRYVIGDVSLDILASIRGPVASEMTLTDPYEAALIGRALISSASLGQAATDVAQALDPRAQSVMSEGVGETEATRLQAEAAAARTYLDGARTATRGGVLELGAWFALKRELHTQVAATVDNAILAGAQ